MFALIIAILLNPFVNYLRKRKLPHVVSIIIAMLLSTVVIWIIFYILSDQLASFSDQLPVLRQKLSAMLLQLQQWVQQTFSIAISKQVQLINELLNSSKGMVGQTVNTVLGAISVLVLIPVYIFLFLFYKQLMLDFLYEVLTTTDSKQVADILGESKTAVQSYMVGLLLEALIIAVLNSVALLILGVEYAILLGVIGALMNILPYIGGIIAIALPVLMSTVTTEGFSTQVGIVIAYLIIQMIDNNFIVPLIVSSKVKINALFSIIAVLLGGALWGISGMFLSIPVTGILKIMFDRIDGLKPWGKLLGYQESVKFKSISLKRKNRKEQRTPS
jgi:predicted PurR-regulated permease PerM